MKKANINKLLALLLTLALCFAVLAGCSNQEADEVANPEDIATEAPASTDAPEESEEDSDEESEESEEVAEECEEDGCDDEDCDICYEDADDEDADDGDDDNNNNNTSNDSSSVSNNNNNSSNNNNSNSGGERVRRKTRDSGSSGSHGSGGSSSGGGSSSSGGGSSSSGGGSSSGSGSSSGGGGSSSGGGQGTVQKKGTTFVAPANRKEITGTISISGSTSLYPVMATLAEAFKKEFPKVNINFSDVTGSGAGRTGANNNRVSFGMVSAEWTSANRSSFPNVIPLQICIDGVAVIVNPQNPTTNITRDNLRSIYNVQPSTDWGAFGGTAGQTISTVNRENGSGTRDCFQSVLGLTGNYDRIQGATILNSTGGVMTAVAGNANAIGYVSLASLDSRVKALSFNGVAANRGNLQNGSYQLQRPFILGVNRNRTLNEAEKQFITYVFSTQGQALIDREGLVSMTDSGIKTELGKVGLG